MMSYLSLLILQTESKEVIFEIINNNIFVPVSLINLDLNSRNNTRYNSLPTPFTIDIILIFILFILLLYVY